MEGFRVRCNLVTHQHYQQRFAVEGGFEFSIVVNTWYWDTLGLGERLLVDNIFFSFVGSHCGVVVIATIVMLCDEFATLVLRNVITTDSMSAISRIGCGIIVRTWTQSTILYQCNCLWIPEIRGAKGGVQQSLNKGQSPCRPRADHVPGYISHRQLNIQFARRIFGCLIG